MTPAFEIFKHVFAVCLDINDKTFDYLPDADTTYPFFYVGESTTSDADNLEIYGECTQTVHIYALRTDRANLEEFTAKLLDALRSQNTASEYYVNFKNCTPQDIPDNTDVQPLIHRVLDIRFSYVKK